MAIRTVVTRGYGTGSFSGNVNDVVLRGYLPDVAEFTGGWETDEVKAKRQMPIEALAAIIIGALNTR